MHLNQHKKNKNTRSYILFLCGLMVIGWIALIFYFSSQSPSDSYKQSSGAVDVFYILDDYLDFTDTVIYEKSVYFFKEVVLQGRYETSNALIRRSAHVGIYLVLGFMVSLMAFFYYKRYHLAFILGISLPTLIAVMDEFRQSFIGRTSSLNDVALDSFGAAAGAILFLLILMF